MSDVRLYVHVVWSVKNRYPLLEMPGQEILFSHIQENAIQKNIILLAINGHTDHVHCLIRLKAVQSVAEVVQLIKGESSHWANQQSLFEKTLTWSRSYYARSVDEKNLYIVKRYINNQHKHQQPDGPIKEYLDRLTTNQSQEPNKE